MSSWFVLLPLYLRKKLVVTMVADLQEDLDLLAFSSLKSNSKDKSDSSPLKGVYRDTTFGLRYLYAPDSTESQTVSSGRTVSLSDLIIHRQVYRRFQVSFTTSALALQLVNAIQDVCPCKINEPNVKDRKKTAAVPVVASRVPVERQDTVMVPNVLASRHVGPMDATLFFSRCAKALPFFPLRQDPPPYQPSYDHPMPNAPQAASTHPGLAQHLSKPPPSSLSSLPDSSPPSSTADSTMMPPPPPPPLQVSMNDVGADGLALTAALREATGLYDLSYAALERLVGDVVREDGFVRLLENMSSMWAMKALVGP
ncbi:hypothetical protein MVEN_02018300 [Mycena venus]|uniref:Uncharacterized protein n=1 Tax=Mycena venus TaxID=2733690 RepID=A0A8H6XC08_9AGAR|nr:hypothetical protein MVEN_02018300 [Mycena venus]